MDNGGTNRQSGDLDRRMAASVDRLGARVDAYTASLKRPHAEIRDQVRAFAESQWGAPVEIVHLGTVEPAYNVPGRREDGSVEGEKLVRRFFWNITRGVVTVVANVFSLANGGGVGTAQGGSGAVRGPANAQALALVDAAKPARSAWLAYTKSSVAVLDSGSDVNDPKNIPPVLVLWHAADVPVIDRGKCLVGWPDGSEFHYVPSAEEARIAAQARKDRLWRDRTVDP